MDTKDETEVKERWRRRKLNGRETHREWRKEEMESERQKESR